MHTVQKYALKLRHVYAPRAEVCPETEARLCTSKAICEIIQTDFSTS